jgi:hypothetical protein
LEKTAPLVKSLTSAKNTFLRLHPALQHVVAVAAEVSAPGSVDPEDHEAVAAEAERLQELPVDVDAEVEGVREEGIDDNVGGMTQVKAITSV